MTTIASATCDIADPSRRRFLASLGALGAAAVVVPTWLNAQETGIVATARGCRRRHPCSYCRCSCCGLNRLMTDG